MSENPRLVNLQRHLMAGHINRRDFVKRATALGFSAPVIAAALAACGGSSTKSTATTAGGAGATTATSAITVNQNASPAAAGSPAATQASSGPAGGSVTLARGTDSDNLDPVTNDGNVNIWIFMNIYDQLVKVADNGIDLSPDLAEKWDVSTDGTEFTFHIRSGVKFSDGTADDGGRHQVVDQSRADDQR